MISPTQQDALALALPSYKHLPGSNQRPDSELLESIASQALSLTQNSSARSNLAWLYGTRLFNEGFYWESHEVLESVWMNAPPNSRERYLLQSVIHIANARLKRVMGFEQAAGRLDKLAREFADRAFPVRAREALMGVSFEQLLVLTDGELTSAQLIIELDFC